jgi:hypothetical protein
MPLGSWVVSQARLANEIKRVGNARICLWDLESMQEIQRLENPGAIHDDGVAHVALCAQRQLAVSEGFGRITSPHMEMSLWKRYSTVCVWSLATGLPRAQFQGPGWRFSPDGRYALALSSRGIHVLQLCANGSSK